MTFVLSKSVSQIEFSLLQSVTKSLWIANILQNLTMVFDNKHKRNSFKQNASFFEALCSDSHFEWCTQPIYSEGGSNVLMSSGAQCTMLDQGLPCFGHLAKRTFLENILVLLELHF